MPDKADYLFFGTAFCCILILCSVIVLDLRSMKTMYGRVIAVEHLSFPWRSTFVTFASYGDTSITRNYEGWLLLELGNTYEITSKTEFGHFYPTAIYIRLINSQNSSQEATQ